MPGRGPHHHSLVRRFKARATTDLANAQVLETLGTLKKKQCEKTTANSPQRSSKAYVLSIHSSWTAQSVQDSVQDAK